MPKLETVIIVAVAIMLAAIVNRTLALDQKVAALAA